jgi:hypothetical protein
MRTLIVLAVLALALPARADCPQTQASCAFQAEGIELLVDGQYAKAEEKFAASIAAEPSARAYLGYAQAVEGLGKLGLGYDSLLVARELSQRELQRDPQSVEFASRGERIAYKLAELAPKVGFVRLQLPPWVGPEQVAQVERVGESSVGNALQREIPVTPNQRLAVTLHSGFRVELVAAVAAGGHAILAVPLRTPGLPMPLVETGPQWTPPPQLAGSVDAIAMTDTGNVGGGLGAGLRFEYRLAPWAAGSVAALALYHPTTRYDEMGVEFSAFEVAVRAGVRTASLYRMFGTFEVGALYFARTASAPAAGGMPALTEVIREVYPDVTLGGGVHLGAVDLRLALMVTSGLPVRAAISLGYGVVQR